MHCYRAGNNVAFSFKIIRMIDWLIDWLINWLTDLSFDQSIGRSKPFLAAHTWRHTLLCYNYSLWVETVSGMLYRRLRRNVRSAARRKCYIGGGDHRPAAVQLDSEAVHDKARQSTTAYRTIRFHTCVIIVAVSVFCNTHTYMKHVALLFTYNTSLI